MADNDVYKDLSLIIAEKQKIIDNLTKEKFSLLKVISHDIRSPFNQLFALLQLIELETEEMSDEMQSYLDKMYHSVIGGMEMIKNLHDMRALDQESISVNPETFPLDFLIRQVIKQFSIQCRIKSIELKYEENIGKSKISTDRILLRKILENIISNGIKYSDIGSKVMIKAELKEDNFEIEISDQGPGLPEEEIEQIFLKLKKLSNTPTQGESTTGLGMYLSKCFAEFIKASIEVENIQEGGLRVRLTLPVKADHSE